MSKLSGKNEFEELSNHDEVQQIFNLLKPEQRELLILRYINDLKIEEIGELKSLSKNICIIHKVRDFLRKEGAACE